MSMTCWLFHWWGSWQIVRHVQEVDDAGRPVGQRIVQCRRCRSCGFVEYSEQQA